MKYTNAIQKCATIGRKMATTKQRISDVIATLEKNGTLENPKEEGLSDKDDNYLEEELEKFVASGLHDDEDPEYKAEVGDVFKAMEHLVTKRKARLKKERKRSRPQQTRGSRPSKRQTNFQLSTRDDALRQHLPKQNPVQEIPLFDIGKCIDPADEWLVLEVPHLPDKDLGIPEPVLISGPKFVPPGCKDLRAVLFVRVSRCFAYTMERADLIFHGQVQGAEKAAIEKRCQDQGLSYLTILPNNKLWRGLGINVAGNESPLYQKCFGRLNHTVSECSQASKT